MRTRILIAMMSLALLALAAAGAGAQTQAEPGPLPPVGAEEILALPSGFGDADISAPADMAALAALFPIQDVQQVAAGAAHTCALTTAGGVKCWGWNYYGQLGDGTKVDIATPVDVVGLGGGVVALAGGDFHTCALTTAGGVKCWGLGSGRLGDGTRTDRLTPVDVVGLGSGVAAVSAGDSHTCALTAAGGVKCWGANFDGQLGDGTRTDRLTPVDVVGLGSGVAAASAGDSHTCALTMAGGVKCWGDNYYGQLGDGMMRQDQLTPVDVVGLGGGVSALSADYGHTCASMTGGGVKCWGYNGYGQLGDGTTTTRSTPVDVVGLTGSVMGLAAGSEHTCVLTAAGGAKCWGSNDWGQLGNGMTGYESTPVDVVGLDGGVTGLAAGHEHTCAVTAAGGAQCWGSNDHGQLGAGTTVYKPTPVNVVGLGSAVAAVAGGGHHTCALTTGGGVRCWGSNAYGQLGDGTTDKVLAPVDVVGLGSGVAAVTAGASHTCALTIAGGVRCWGANGAGQLGDGTTTNRSTPVNVAGLANGVASISAGGGHTCALTTTGGVKCWGFNNDGQLGDGTTVSRNTPVDVAGLGSAVAAVTAGWDHTCALMTAGGVKCWGYNYWGQLGDGKLTLTNPVPVNVLGLGSGVAAVAAGGGHTCALTAMGELKCWGLNNYGQLGDGTTANKSTPVAVSGLASGVATVAVGGRHTCVLTAWGGVKCWGDNTYGGLGDGTTVSRSTPVDVVGLTSGAVTVAVGGTIDVAPVFHHTCAVTTAGGAKCWGYNRFGQLGDGSAWRTTPGDVLIGCYTLALTHVGEGSDPAASPLGAIPCPAGYYTAGMAITFTAAPAADWRVAGWSGTSNDASTATTNSLAMPSADTTVSVHYAPPIRQHFLPIVLRRWPPIPDAPTLNAISPPAANPNYTMSWNAAYLADTYILEQATNASFSDATRAYTGSVTSKAIPSEGIATYFYRVKARNSYGDSPWSNAQTVEVRWEREPNYPYPLASGPLRSGVDYYGYPDDARDYFTFQTSRRGQLTVDLSNHTGQGVQLILYHPAGVEVAKMTNPPYHLIYTGDAGEYYVQIYSVSGFNSNSPYTLRATFP